VYSANGLYDPDITGTGHQPAYFDQFMAIYDHYTVFRSRIRIEVSQPVAGSDSGMVVLYINDGGTLATTAEQAAEQVNSLHKMVLVGSTRPTILNMMWDAKKFFGGDVFDNDTLQGSASANPTEQSNFVLAFQANAAANVFGAYFVTLEYEAVFDELKSIAQS